MLLLWADNLSQSFAGHDIFSGVSFEIQAGEKLAIVGPNGIGKTSLLKILAGQDEPASGSLKYPKPVSAGMTVQDFTVVKDTRIIEYLMQAAPDAGLRNDLGAVIKRFNFTGREDDFISTLSGGEKTRLQLAGIYLAGAELLLLDEPTNHLDQENLHWLEEFINTYPQTVVLVSHDRRFLDRTVNRILDLGPDGITSYPGNYTCYYNARLEKRRLDEKTFWDQEKQARKLQEAIDERKAWAGKAHDQAASKAREIGVKSAKYHFRAKAKKMEKQVKNNIKRLERMQEERIARPKKNKAIDLSFTGGRRAASSILLADGITKSYGLKNLFVDSNLSLQYGEKAGLMGANGSGKTTLLRILAGAEPPDKGHLWLSPSLRIGYLEQEISTLDPSLSILEELAGVCSDQGRVRQLLADLLLTGDAVFKLCSVLSMGERVRVALARLLLFPYDLLLLDEPTNYLDLPSREKLEQALQAYSGSIIIVSHDRWLMDQVATSTWHIDAGKIQVYPGPCSEYWESWENKHWGAELETHDRLELEFRKARLLGELSTLDRVKNEAEYLRLEKEFQDTVRKLMNLTIK
ncbi:MAG: ribosomal protection-like ABC-F family protein [Syntrophomonadaceae bacterium]